MRRRGLEPRAATRRVTEFFGAPIASAAPAAVAASTPVTIMGANCTEWWRADLGITIGTGVSAWAGQVGGKNFTQGTGTAQPAYNATGGPNSTPSILLDGLDDFMDGDAIARAVPQCIWAVLRQVTWQASDSLLNDANVSFIILQRTATPTIAMSAGTANNNNNGLTVNSYRRLQAEFTGSAADALRIGSTVSTGASAGSTAGTIPLLGRNAGSTTFGNGEYCEIALFNAIPSAGQQSQLDAYVTARYGAGLT